MNQVTITGDGVSAVVQARGAMTTATFEVGDRRVDPFHTAAWPPYPQDPLLDRLRGDFLCVPFGMSPPGPLPGGWRSAAPSGHPHGYGSNADWDLSADGATATCVLDYPEGDAVARLTRRVTCAGGGLEFVDTILPRSDIALPIGLHPILRLPERPGGASLVLPGGRLYTPPVAPEPTARLLPDAVFDDPTAAPGVDGAVDLTRLPFDGASEDLVLLADVERASVDLINHDEGYRVTVAWDGALLRHLMLWISNRGRPFPPWDGRNLCLGIEPVTAAFDLGPELSQEPNPLSERGVATMVRLEAGREVVLRHSVRVSEEGRP